MTWADRCSLPCSRAALTASPVDDPASRRPDTRLARERLGWAPRVDWAEGLKRTIGWFSRYVAA